MVILAHPLHDPARRANAPARLWGEWQPVMGEYPNRYAPILGVQYGQMEAQSGHCERYPDITSSHCSGWHTRVRKLPHSIDCQRDSNNVTRCTISPSGAEFSPGGTLTVTLYVREYDLQYRTSFDSIAHYLGNAIGERGLDTATLRKELSFLRAVLTRLPEEARLPALCAFTGQKPNGHMPSLEKSAQAYLDAYPAIPRNTNPEAGKSSLVAVTHKAR